MENTSLLVSRESKLFGGTSYFHFVVQDGVCIFLKTKTANYVASDSSDANGSGEILATFSASDFLEIKDKAHPKASLGIDLRAISIVLKDGTVIDFDFVVYPDLGLEDLKHALMPDFIAEYAGGTGEFGLSYINFKIEKTGLTITFDDDAGAAISTNPELRNHQYSDKFPLEDSMTFSVEFVSGDATEYTKTKKEARIGITAALFPIIPVASILVPAKKVQETWTVDDRLFEVQISGQGWQFLCPVPARELDALAKFRHELQKAVIKFGSKSKLKGDS